MWIAGHLIQCFLEVRETELLRSNGHLLNERIREVDFLIALQLVLPVLAV